jgi:uncharacterized membrane protein YtjA (UPF0391 family)
VWAPSYAAPLGLLTATRQGGLSPRDASATTLLLSQPEVAKNRETPETRAIRRSTTRSIAMLHYAVVFFIIALIAAVFGFGGIAAGAVSIGKILFIVFAILAVASFLFGLIKKG